MKKFVMLNWFQHLKKFNINKKKYYFYKLILSMLIESLQDQFKMKQMKNKLFKINVLSIVFFITLIVVPSSTAQEISMDQISFRPQKTENGLIFGSITFPKEKARFTAYYLKLSFKSTDKKIARKNSKEIEFKPTNFFKISHAGELDNGLTYLFALERPVGEYEFSSIRLYSNSGFLILDILNGEPIVGGFSIPVKVNKGEITYVGNISFNEYAEKNEKIVTYQNNFKKDLVGIKKEQQYVYWDVAKNDTLRKIEYKNE